jgi:uncharacterized membrane protein YeaQ/YmgE (transglycosylase-associated protein family)
VSVVGWIVLGLAAGALVQLLMRPSGSARGDWLVALTVGVLGALIGGFLAAVLLGLDISGLDPTSLLVAGVGALMLMLLLRTMPDADVFE